MENQWHSASLERIFIENRIYRDIEEVETWVAVIKAIDKGLNPFTAVLKRSVTEEDIVKLTEIRIKRISKFDIDKAQQKIDALEADIGEVKNNLNHLINFAIRYFDHLLKTYGKDKQRKTEITTFDDVDAKKVVVRNQKLYVNKEEGFIGTGLRKDEFVFECSDIDDIIVFTQSGIMQVVKVDSKVFIEKNIIHTDIFKRKDSRTIYNMIYRDGKNGTCFVKRFPVTGVTRDKPYDLTQGKPNSELIYFTANSNGEAEIVSINLRNTGTIKKLKWDIDFADYLIKGRNSKGNIVTKYTIRKNGIELKEKGKSTLKPRDIWIDTTVQRLNTDGRGKLLGAFKGGDKLIEITGNAIIKVMTPELTLHFDKEQLVLEKWVPKKPITAVYYDNGKNKSFLKRFLVENENKEDLFIKEKTELLFVSTEGRPVLEINFSKTKRGEDPPKSILINAEEFIGIKGIKAVGNQLTDKKIKSITLKESLPFSVEDSEIDAKEIEVNEEIHLTNDDSQITLDL